MLDIVVSVQNGHARIRLRGELTIETVDALASALVPLRGECRTAEVNLAGLVFMDSSGVGALLSLSGDLQESGGSLVVTEIPPLIRAVLETLGLLEILFGSKEVDAIGTRTAGHHGARP